ncbi:D-amino acid dehydrogenase [Polaromonas jejuensis]|uniref:D-amino acid dehydrogenase n=1 Tax=Polaromonas jejuensis TaxID=457502 RepID=A0ABW0QED2_9BURK|nr:D-amino acid dehydrogenase [Polaromonas jejuensis]
MRVIVLGAGVVGVATAYYLWRDGHRVTVVERQPGPGLETSYGNAGGLCPSFAGPWAAPGMVGKVLKMALQPNSPVRFSLWPDLERLRWVRQWAGNCNVDSFGVNKARMQRVAHYSLACLRKLAEEADLDGFDYHCNGVLQIFRTPQELELGRIAARTLQELGIPWKMLDPADASAVEPALAASSEPWIGALHLPSDASGDSHKFCTSLSAYLQARGVVFRYDTSVRALQHCGGDITGVDIGVGERLEADAYVVALGSQAPSLLRPLGLRLPVYPLKGYSITVPIVDDALAPHVAIMDEHHKIMVSRLGDRIRVAGMAELVGHDLQLQDDRRALLMRLTRELLPNGLDFARTEFWAGLRPMTPDGPPVLGPTRIGRLFLNGGHGSNGWTQACGTSRIVADMVSGRQPEIDTEGLTAGRFGMGYP